MGSPSDSAASLTAFSISAWKSRFFLPPIRIPPRRPVYHRPSDRISLYPQLTLLKLRKLDVHRETSHLAVWNWRIGLRGRIIFQLQHWAHLYALRRLCWTGTRQETISTISLVSDRRLKRLSGTTIKIYGLTKSNPSFWSVELSMIFFPSMNKSACPATPRPNSHCHISLSWQAVDLQSRFHRGWRLSWATGNISNISIIWTEEKTLIDGIHRYISSDRYFFRYTIDKVRECRVVIFWKDRFDLVLPWASSFTVLASI